MTQNTTTSAATIQLQNDNFTSNLTISYQPCSVASSTTRRFQPPVVHLTNLTADTMYCYSITHNESATTVTDDKTVVVSCNGTFITAADTTATPTTLPPIKSHNPQSHRLQPQVSHHYIIITCYDLKVSFMILLAWKLY